MFQYLVDGVRYLANRPSLRARICEDDESTEVGGLKFEVENVGGRPTSLQPHIPVTYWVPTRGVLRRHSAVYAVREVNRELLPFRARTFSASAVGLHDGYGFSWFRTYSLRTTTGHWLRVHTRHALLDPLGAVRFHWELLQYRLIGRLDAEMPSSIDNLQAQKRLRGPH